MPNNSPHIAQLIIKQLNDDITDTEKAELQAWIDESESNKQIAEQFLVDENLLSGIRETYRADEKVWNRLNETISQKPARIRTIKPWIKWTAAAAIIIIIATVAVFSLRTKDQTKPSVANITHDVPAPKDSRAVIVLADGTKVYLDSVGNGTIAQQNNVNVVKNANGEILYLPPAGGATGEVSPAGGGGLNDSPNNKRPGVDFNTLTNPRGSKVITMTLSDGSHVWLNAGSSLTYPVAFVGNERKVSITGEAYFEVAHNASKPFIVSKGETSVTVLGTHFNVNAYDDEESLKVTLLEGSVKVTQLSPAGGGGLNDAPNNKRPGVDNSVVIKPSEQSVIIPQTRVIRVLKDVDVSEAIAWKNGYFIFNSATTDDIMRQLSRWYDVEIVYEGNVKSERFAGSVPRTANVSQVLKVLELTKTVRFTIEGKKITVKSF